jgi:hypothetical protein
MALPTPEALFAPLAACRHIPPGCCRGHVSLVTWLAAGLPLAALFPDHFSLLAYTIGVIAFVTAEQGVARGLS